MTDRATTKQSSSYSASTEPSSWAVGAILFAAVMMMMAGLFQIIAGVAALFENDFYVSTSNYVFHFDVTTWGWIHLVIGLLVGVAGFGVLRGNLVARILGIGIAALSAVTNFMFIPYYPLWSITIIALDIFVIWALAAHGRDAMVA
jgi:hypothetical protein